MWLKEIGVEVVVGLIGTIEIDACRRIGERGHVREVLLGIDPGHQGDMIADAAVDPLQTDIEGEWMIEDVGWMIEDVGWTIGWIEEIGDIGHNNVRTTVDLHIFFGGCGGATLCRLQCIDKLVYRYLQVYR